MDISFELGSRTKNIATFLWPNLDKLSQVLQTESWRTNVDGNSRTWSHLHCDLPPRRCSNCSSMLVLYLVLACCLDYFLIHLFCLTNHNLTCSNESLTKMLLLT